MRNKTSTNYGKKKPQNKIKKLKIKLLLTEICLLLFLFLNVYIELRFIFFGMIYYIVLHLCK